MQLLDNYLKAKREIHEYFEYEPNWKEIPIEDFTNFFWSINDEVNYHEDEQVVIDLDGNHYVAGIYKQRFLQKWIYRKEDYTMICIDTYTDGNKFLAIFDNKKEIIQ